MSANIFQSVTEKFRGSPLCIPLTVACLLGIAIAIAATVADYRSSYEGYVRLPTEKVPEVVWLIAMLPQVGQIIFGTYFALTVETDAQGLTRAQWIYAIIAFLLFLWDNGTDVFFKTAGFIHPVYVWVIAIIESLTIYTVGSEILLVISFGLFIHLLPSALYQSKKLFAGIISGGQYKGSGNPPKGLR